MPRLHVFRKPGMPSRHIRRKTERPASASASNLIRKKRTLSAEAREKIAAAQRKRCAKQKKSRVSGEAVRQKKPR
jgi:hypothetical protein